MRRAICPGSFDPLHLGHCAVIRRASLKRWLLFGFVDTATTTSSKMWVARRMTAQ